VSPPTDRYNHLRAASDVRGGTVSRWVVLLVLVLKVHCSLCAGLRVTMRCAAAAAAAAAVMHAGLVRLSAGVGLKLTQLTASQAASHGLTAAQPDATVSHQLPVYTTVYRLSSSPVWAAIVLCLVKL